MPIGFLHHDLVSQAIRPERIGCRGPRSTQRIARERFTLRPVAGVQDTDDNAAASARLATERGPDAVRAGQLQEVNRFLVVNEPAGPVLGNREHARRVLQRARLVWRQGCRKTIKTYRKVLERFGPNL